MISIRNISKQFNVKNDKFTALKKINFEINDGEIFGIIGKSGAGKTTLMRLLTQLDYPSEGEILFDDKLMTNELKKQIGVVFQGYPLLKQRNIFNNVAFPLKLQKCNKEIIKNKVEKILKDVGLYEHRDKYPSQMSGGQKQRIAIARALVFDPKIILLDEPTSALDIVTTYEIVELLKKINKERNVTIIIVTHEIGIIRNLCDRIVVLNDGQVVDIGETERVFTKPTSDITKQLIGWRD